MSEHTPLTRRRVLQATGVAAGIGLLGTGTASLSQEGTETTDATLDATMDWPQLQGNAAKTGVAGGGPTSPNVRWEHQLDSVTGYSQPVVKDGTVYATYGTEGEQGGLVALTTDGEEKWRYQTDSETTIGDTPAVADDLVFATGQTFRRNDCGEKVTDAELLLAVDTATGEEVYRRTVQGVSAKNPTVANGFVYVVVPGRSVVSEGTLVAYETTSGTEQWRASTGGYGLAAYKSPPASVADGRVYIAEHDVAAFDAETGEEVWRANTDSLKGQFRSNAPAVANGTVYVGTNGEEGTFYALSADDGSTEWVRDAASEVFSSAAVTSETVYVSMGTIDDPPEGVLALSADDGSKQWLNEDVSLLRSPIRGGEYVYVGRDALSPEDGSIAWSLDGENDGTAVAGDTLYLGGPSVIAVGEE